MQFNMASLVNFGSFLGTVFILAALVSADPNACEIPGDAGSADSGEQLLQFTLLARSIPTKDIQSAADAYVNFNVLQIDADNNTVAIKCNTTDIARNTPHPSWNQVFQFYYRPNTGQQWKFEIFDHDIFNKDDEIATTVVDVDEYVQAGQYFNVSLGESAFLIVEKAMAKSFRLYARHLPRKDNFGGKSDAFVEAYWRMGSDGTENLLATTSVVDNDDNPDWKETLMFAHYKKDADQWLTFKLYDSDPATPKDFIGDLAVEADKVFADVSTKTYDLNNTYGRALFSIIVLD